MRRLYNTRSYSESDEQQSEEEDTSFKIKKNYSMAPRFRKNDIAKINTKAIVINISKTQYDVVEEVAQQLGWEVETSRKSEKWDVMWIDTHIQAHDLFKLHQHQKISHFPAIYILTRKNFLGRSLMKMSKFYPQKYNFFPSTWSVPADSSDLMRFREKLQKDGCDPEFYIYKPEAMAQGKGIKIYDNIDKLINKQGIVQLYINDPFLIENLKFDLRIYVLIMGYDPLRVFIYDQGLGRFATQKYKPARKKNMKDVYMHLTNYAINKNNKNFIFNTSDKNMNKGHKRSLTAIYEYFQSKGVDVQALKNRIDEMIIKTLIVGQPMIAHTYGLAQGDNNSNDLCFQILGFDILLNDKLQPILLEVNHTPSFKTDTPLDKVIKKDLIKDTLVLLNMTVQNKKQKIEKKKQFIELRSQRKLPKLTHEEKQIQKFKKWNQREEHEAKNLGKFRKIFPLLGQQNKYDEMIDRANKIFNEHHGFKNKKRFSNTSRPKSFGKVPNIPNVANISSVPPCIQEKIAECNHYSKTVGINLQENSDQIMPSKLVSEQTCKFPSISSPEKIRNHSGYMRHIQSQSRVPFSRDEKKLKIQSCSPVKKNQRIIKPSIQKIGNLQKQLINRGSYLAPTIMQLHEACSQNKDFDVNMSSSAPVKQFYPNTPAMTKKTEKVIQRKKVDDIVVESSSTMSKLSNSCKISPTKLCTYQNLVNRLSMNGDELSMMGSVSLNLGRSIKNMRMNLQLPVLKKKKESDSSKFSDFKNF